MGFGQNLQFLRRMHQGMTQEELAEKLGVTRQTVSRWEMDAAFPEMDKAVALCSVFSCSLDDLIRKDMASGSGAYTDIRLVTVPEFSYIAYTVISREPEDDAIRHLRDKAQAMGISEPDIIGLDFPHVSQEQQNLHRMRGYTVALRLPEGFDAADAKAEVQRQGAQLYAAITIHDPFIEPFSTIPGAYRVLMQYMAVNRIRMKQAKDVLPCFEKEYQEGNGTFLDVFIAAEA